MLQCAPLPSIAAQRQDTEVIIPEISCLVDWPFREPTHVLQFCVCSSPSNCISLSCSEAKVSSDLRLKHKHAESYGQKWYCLLLSHSKLIAVKFLFRSKGCTNAKVVLCLGSDIWCSMFSLNIHWFHVSWRNQSIYESKVFCKLPVLETCSIQLIARSCNNTTTSRGNDTVTNFRHLS
jgi:hypothetical protein